MSETTNNYYLPFLRTGLNTRISTSSSDPKRNSLTVKMKVSDSATTRSANINIHLYGPGDVLGFAPHAIVKTQPLNGIGNFTPNLMPFVEFGDTDFLWRYSTEKNTQKKYWIPWLSLIVLKISEGDGEGEFEYLPQTDPKLSRQIKILENAILPDLKEQWRWAHVHINHKEGATSEELKNILQQNPEKAVSRLLCPRRLESGAKYAAFIIPTYRLGIEAALGLDVMSTGTLKNALAWSEPALGKNQIIPFYYKWEFRTGSRGDLEFLIKELEYRKVEGMGVKSIDASLPGYGIKFTDDELQDFQAMQIEGAIQSTEIERQPVGYDRPDFSTPKKHQEDLKNLLNIKVQTEDGEEILRVAPPTYGQWHQEFQEAEPIQDISKRHWLNELNLDFRHRYAAGLGTEFVKKNQEQLMKSAWQQLKEVKKVNRALNLGKFGREVSSCMHKRLNMKEKGKLLQIGLAVQSKVMCDDPTVYADYDPDAGIVYGNYIAINTVDEVLQEQSITEMMRQVKMRKYFVKKYEKNINENDRWNFTKIADQQIEQSNYIPAGMSLDYLDESIFHSDSYSSIEYEKFGEMIYKHLNPNKTIEKRLCNKIERIRNWEEDSLSNPYSNEPLRPVLWYPQFPISLYQVLRDESPELLLPGIGDIPQNTVTLLNSNNRFIEAFMIGANHEFGAELRWREYPTDLRGTYFRKFWDFSIYSIEEADRVKFRQSSDGLHFLQKMRKQYPTLDHFLKTVDGIEDIFTNPTLSTQGLFVEVVAKYEAAISKWLFSKDDSKGLRPIHLWEKEDQLGTHFMQREQDAPTDQSIILIRGEVLNKYPNLIIYLVKKEEEDDTIPNFNKKVYPIFEADIPSDINCFGFPISEEEAGQYFLVFEEPISEVTYGLDEGKKNDDVEVREIDVAWQHFDIEVGDYLNDKMPTDTESFEKWNSPSYAAKIFTQRSVRVSIPLSRFIFLKKIILL